MTPPPLQRLLFICEPCKDGVFDYVRNLVAHLNKKHPQLIIDFAYSSTRSGDELQEFLEYLRNRGSHTVDLKIGNAPQFRDFSAMRKIARMVSKNKPQLIQAHSSKAGGLARVLKLLRPSWPPVIYTPNAYYGLSGEKTLRASVFNLMESMLGHIGIASASSPDEREFALKVLKLPPRKVVPIFNGIDVHRFEPPGPDRKAFVRQIHDLPADATIIISVGRDNPQKNYGPLYRAMEEVLPKFPKAYFFHAGAGASELGEKYLSAASRKQFKHIVYVKQLEEILQASDAFILTSRYEGLSLAVLDALATNLKMFLTRVTGNQCFKQLGFDQISWIEHTENDQLMAENIRRSLEDWLTKPKPPDGQQRKTFLSWFDSQTQFGKLEKLYGAVIAQAEKERLLTHDAASPVIG